VLANPAKLSSRRGASGQEDFSSSEPQAPRTHTRYGRVGIAGLIVLGVSGLLVLSHVQRPAQKPTTGQRFHLDLSIEDPTGQALTQFYSALTGTLGRSKTGNRSGVTRILHYGDSHIAADILTGALRRHFADDFGSSGPGYIVPGVSWYSRLGVESGSTAGWHLEGTGQPELGQSSPLGIAGVALVTNLAGQRLWISAESTSFDIYLFKQPGGGKIEVLLDGASYGAVSLASTHSSPSYFLVTANSMARHSLEIRTLSVGAVRVLGVAVEQEDPGVVYDAFGINGARATRPLTWDWGIVASNLQRRRPDLIVISYGTNEAGDQDLDFDLYRRRYAEVIARFRSAVPGASILAIAPPDRARRIGNRWISIPEMGRIVSAQREAALSTGAAFCDLYDEMGGSGSIEEWASASALAGPDRVHLTTTGYRLVADRLYLGLEGAYLRSVWRAFGQAIMPFFDFKHSNTTMPLRKRRQVSLTGGQGGCNTRASSISRFS